MLAFRLVLYIIMSLNADYSKSSSFSIGKMLNASVFATELPAGEGRE